MSGSQVFIYVFFGILVAGSLFYSWILATRSRKEALDCQREYELLKIQYDQIRKEKIDQEDRLNQAESQERTYKVAFEDWKSKYSLLEENFLRLRKELESQVENPHKDMEALKNELLQKSERINMLENQLQQWSLQSSATKQQAPSDSKIIADLKSILDQHLAIISQIIGDEKMEQYTQKSTPADPLHLIKGIDAHISQALQSHGIRSFEQIAQIPKKDLRKWMIEFEDIDDKLIESWPYQAEAILNVRHNAHV